MHIVAEARAQFQRLRADVGVTLSEIEGDGVRISALQSGGAAERAGLRVGDVVDHVNFKETDDVDDFNQALTSILAGDSVPFEIRRDGTHLTVVVQTGARGMSADQLRLLRATASGHVDDADAKERRNTRDHAVTSLSLGTTIEHDEEHDQVTVMIHSAIHEFLLSLTSHLMF
jgi:plastocyanin